MTPLDQPLDAIIFDCDGTLSKIEGIDTLAEINGVGEQVQHLTAQAMAETGISHDLYERRLNLVRPMREQAKNLGSIYFEHRIDDIESVMSILSALGKAIFVVSAGNNPSVKLFSDKLGVPADRVWAVDLLFDQDGSYRDFDRTSPCARRGGKREVVQEIKQQYPRVMHVGDGLNDLEVKDLVTRFVGFGGVYFRDNIQAQCEFYLTELSMLPLLPLALTEDEIARLSEHEQNLVRSVA